MDVSFSLKPFAALSAPELYQLLRLREKVFIIEQNCVYEDIDGKDAKALHVLGHQNGEIVAYARLFKPGDYFPLASIGRVVVDPSLRGTGLGHELMNAAVSFLGQNLSAQPIQISAQAHLEKFYKQHGFEARGAGYLEDGIPHVAMFRP